MKRKPLPSLLQEANKAGFKIRNTADLAIYYFTKRKKKKLTVKPGTIVTMGGRNIGKTVAIEEAKKKDKCLDCSRFMNNAAGHDNSCNECEHGVRKGNIDFYLPIKGLKK